MKGKGVVDRGRERARHALSFNLEITLIHALIVSDRARDVKRYFRGPG